MYSPYLYGRDAELAAIVARSTDFGAPQQIVPVLEPALRPDGDVTRYVNKLTRSLDALKANGAVAYVVANPDVGRFQDPTIRAQWLAGMAQPLGDPGSTRPTFKVRAGATTKAVSAFAGAHPGRDLGIVVANERTLPAAHLAGALTGRDVVVFLLPNVDSADFVAAFGSSKVVRVMDNFAAQVRNADYSGSELFANNHLTHTASGLGGFADFTVLPPTVSFSGGRTGAAVVHLTFEESNQDFWVEHFVSDETDVAQGTFQSKLLEALAHLHGVLTSNPHRFVASPALADYAAQLTSGNATSQGKNKQLQIEHHLFLVARHLRL
ncbi:sce7725 family protein [Nocardioides sp. MH1]|uniref:sce7725 family protein n=1 Tax=Nocardioides sp. MH1 TaxID=3242490 RepID=UPI0035215A12